MNDDEISDLDLIDLSPLGQLASRAVASVGEGGSPRHHRWTLMGQSRRANNKSVVCRHVHLRVPGLYMHMCTDLCS